MKKNICLYISNFIYKFGGTESYTANLISSLQQIDSDFFITIITEHFKETEEMNSKELSERLFSVYGVTIDISRLLISYIPSKEYKGRFSYFIFQRKINALTKKFDVFIYCSRGLLTGKAKNNIAVIHFPMESKTTFKFYSQHPLFRFIAKYTDKKYKKCYTSFLPNSQFTASWLKKLWNITDDKIFTLYPPVTPINSDRKISKEKNILICSRIERSKCIDSLIKAYLSSELLTKEFKLIIAGSIKNEKPEYIDYLRKIDNRIIFIFEPERKQIEELYLKSMIFWHAKGYEADENVNPYLMEHFGITTVEAMSAGCVPVVINKGGQREIVTEGCGYRWNTLDELISYTEDLACSSEKLSAFSKAAQERSNLFTINSYIDNLHKTIIKLQSEGKF